MLKTHVMSEDDYRSFLRPAVYDSLRQVLKFYGLDGAAQIYYNGENEIAKLVGSNTSDPIRTDTYTDGVYRNKLFVIADFQETDFNTGYGNQRRTVTERPVWSTMEEIPMALYPGFSGIRVEVSVVAGFNSVKLAEQFVRRINRAQQAQMVDMNFSATVHLGVNPGILALFEHIHGLHLKNDPSTPELANWFSQYCQMPITVISNVAGKNQRIVFPMKLDNIGITFSEPKIQRARKAEIFGMYEAELKYAFYFQEFTHWELEYPLNIYQDEIDHKWIPRPQEKFTEKFNVRVNPEMAFIQPFTENRTRQAPYFLRLPNHDPWAMHPQNWIQPIVQARLRVDDVPEQELLNIFDIPGYAWNEKVKAYMLRRREVAFSHHDTPFLVMFFSERLHIPDYQLAMEETGAIKLLRAPTMKNTHRVVVTLDYAIRDYSDAFWDDLRNHPEDWDLIKDIFNWIDWDKIPEPWIDNIHDILKKIDKGMGLPHKLYNRYNMELGLKPYLLLSEK